MNARIAAYTRWAHEDTVAGTEPARAASPGRLAYWERRVDPDGKLSEAERERRAERERKAHFSRLAKRAVEARRRKASP